MGNILAMNNLEGKLIPENVIFLQCFRRGFYFPRKERKISVCNKRYSTKGCIGSTCDCSNITASLQDGSP